MQLLENLTISYVARSIFLLDSTTLENRGFVIKFTWEKLNTPFPFEDLLCNWHNRSTENPAKIKRNLLKFWLIPHYPNILCYWVMH